MNTAIGEYYSVTLSSVLQLVITITHVQIREVGETQTSLVHPDTMYRAMASMNLQVLRLLIGCRHAEGCGER